MKDKQILQGLKEILTSLNEEELCQVVPNAYILAKKDSNITQQLAGEKKQNILGKISFAGAEKIKNAKEFISKKMQTDQGEKKEEIIKKEKAIIADNPFLKYKQEHTQNFSEKNNG